MPWVASVSAMPPIRPDQIVYTRRGSARPVEHREPTGGGPDADDVVQAARDSCHNATSTMSAPGDIHEHLDHVGPDHRRDATAHVYQIMAAPSTTIVIETGTPVTIEMTSAVANSRMPSASDRVTRNSPAATVLTAVPKRCCRSW